MNWTPHQSPRANPSPYGPRATNFSPAGHRPHHHRPHHHWPPPVYHNAYTTPPPPHNFPHPPQQPPWSSGSSPYQSSPSHPLPTPPPPPHVYTPSPHDPAFSSPTPTSFSAQSSHQGDNQNYISMSPFMDHNLSSSGGGMPPYSKRKRFAHIGGREGRGRTRGKTQRGGRGRRGGGRGGRGEDERGIDAYYDKFMLEDPWRDLLPVEIEKQENNETTDTGNEQKDGDTHIINELQSSDNHDERCSENTNEPTLSPNATSNSMIQCSNET